LQNDCAAAGLIVQAVSDEYAVATRVRMWLDALAVGAAQQNFFMWVTGSFKKAGEDKIQVLLCLQAQGSRSHAKAAHKALPPYITSPADVGFWCVSTNEIRNDLHDNVTRVKCISNRAR